MTRVLVLGGARSGKSEFAEALLADASRVEYVATGLARPDDPEWTRRIRVHRERRRPDWATTETLDVAAVLRAAGPPVLLDSITTWLGAFVRDDGLASAVDELVVAWESSRRRVVAVSDEVGLGVVPDTAAGRVFRDELGTLNRRLAAAADEVHLVVAGLALRMR